MRDTYSGSQGSKPMTRRELIQYKKRMNQSIKRGEKISKESQEYHKKQQQLADQELENYLSST